MYKKLLQFLSPFLLLLAACGAPTAEDVAFECAKLSKSPGQIVAINNTDYSCPEIPDPSPTSETLETHLNQTAATLCQKSDPVWFQPETAQWLADHVGGDASEWSSNESSWIYDPRDNPLGGGEDYETRFRYPGFGTATITEYTTAKTFIITATNQQILPQLQFTKLELTCP